MNFTQLTTIFVAMLAITNPIGNAAIFVSLVADRPVNEQHWAAIQTSIAVAITLLITTWVGTYILQGLGISIPSFKVAGGLIIILLGLKMMSPNQKHIAHSNADHEHALAKDSIAVVPMTIPIIAGPGAMTTLIASSSQHTDLLTKVYVSMEMLVLTLIIGIVLYFSSNISKLLGPSGIKIATKLMGLLLVSIAVGTMASGLKGLFPILAS